MVCCVAQEPAPAPVIVAEVFERTVQPQATYVAEILPNRRAVIGSAVDGRVETFQVDAGQPVQQGDTLATILSATIRIELAAAEAERDLRDAERKELENGSLPEEIALAKAQLAAAQAAAEYAKSRLSRAETLYQAQAGLSAEEYGAVRSQSLRAAAALDEARNQLQLVEDGPRAEKLAQAEARFRMQEQVVAGIEDRIRKYTLRAPFEGFVSREQTEVGAWLKQGDAVAEVIEIDPVEVVVNVPETAISHVRLEHECEIQVAALPGRRFVGTVASIVPQGDSQSRSFPVKIRVPNPTEDPQSRLMPGMLARVTLPTGPESTSLLVPKDGLNLAGDAATAMKVVGDKVVAVPVRKGAAFGELIQVTSVDPDALQAGDTIVVRGNERLRPGQAVAIRNTIDSAEFLPETKNPARTQP